MEIFLLTLSFLLAGLIIGKTNWKGAALLSALYLITVGTTLYFQGEKIVTVTVQGETFKAKNVVKKNGMIKGVRLDNGENFAASGSVNN